MTKGWLETIRGAVGMGLTWAVGWALVGALVGITTGFLPDGHFLQSFLDPWVALATPGFVGGVVFSVLVRVAEGSRTFVELSLSRAGTWGAVSGVLLGSLPFAVGSPNPGYTPWLLAVAMIGSAILLSAVSACASLVLARVAVARGNS